MNEISIQAILHEVAHHTVARHLLADAILSDELDLSGPAAKYVFECRADAITERQRAQIALAGPVMDKITGVPTHHEAADYLDARAAIDAAGEEPVELVRLSTSVLDILREEVDAIRATTAEFVAQAREQGVSVVDREP